MAAGTVFTDLEALLKHVDSKFTLVNVVTKRTRQLNNGVPPLVDDANPNKPVSTSFEEVGEGKIHYHRVKEGLK